MAVVGYPIVAYATLELNGNGSITDGLIEGVDQEYIILAAWFRVVNRRTGAAPVHKVKLMVNDQDITFNQPIKVAPGVEGDLQMWNYYPEIWAIPFREPSLTTQGARLVDGDDLQAQLTISGSQDELGKVEVFVLLLPTGG